MSRTQEAKSPPTFPELVDADGALASAVGRSDLTPAQADEAERLIRQAACAGRVTWETVERSELRRIINNWASLLDRVGRDAEIPELEGFARALPSADPMDASELVARVKEGKPLIAVRVENADLRELSGLSGLRIVDSVLVGCNFEGVESHELRILHSNLRDCSFEGGVLPDLVATSSVFSGGSMAGVISQGATFSGTQFENLDAAGCDLSRASFGASILSGVRAQDAVLRDCLFDLASLKGCDFARADLAHAIFAGANVRENSFQDADLTLAIFSGTDVRGSSFNGATVERTFFEKAIDVPLADFDPDAADAADFAELDRQQLRSG